MDARTARTLSYAGVLTCFAAAWLMTRLALRGSGLAGQTAPDVLIGGGAWLLLALSSSVRRNAPVTGGTWPVVFGWLAPVVSASVTLAGTPFLFPVLAGDVVLAACAVGIQSGIERRWERASTPSSPVP